MVKRTRKGANAPEARYNGSVVHKANVPADCTLVNIECVQPQVEVACMIEKQTTGTIIRNLMDRAGHSVRSFALAAGYSHGSGVQRYIEADFDGQLRPDVARRLAGALAGRGSPPISESEIYGLVGIPESNAMVVKYEGASDVVLTRDFPVYGTSLGAPREFDGKGIEQTMLNTGNVIEYIKRPSILNGQGHAYGLYVQGSSMTPRFDDGETLFVTDSRHSNPRRYNGRKTGVLQRKAGTVHFECRKYLLSVHRGCTPSPTAHEPRRRTWQIPPPSFQPLS
jgi:hypothetical protein